MAHLSQVTIFDEVEEEYHSTIGPCTMCNLLYSFTVRGVTVESIDKFNTNKITQQSQMLRLKLLM